MRALLVATGALLLAACGQSDAGSEAVNNATGAEAGREKGSLASLLAAEPRFVALIRAAGMQPVLEGREPYTVLAPTGAALDALPPGTLERLQQPAARAELTGLLRRHILPGTVTQADLLAAVKGAGGTATLASMAGDPLTVSQEGGALRIADSNTSARLVGPESRASNGVIHRIDAVLPAPPTGTGSISD